jgi:DNA-directed RNA polymerase subunit RPC12/RpoP
MIQTMLIFRESKERLNCHDVFNKEIKNMDLNPIYKCEKCGWSGLSTNAIFPMHPSKDDGPRCPKCFNQLTKKSN